MMSCSENRGREMYVIHILHLPFWSTLSDDSPRDYCARFLRCFQPNDSQKMSLCIVWRTWLGPQCVCMLVCPLPVKFIWRPLIGKHWWHDRFLGLSLHCPPSHDPCCWTIETHPSWHTHGIHSELIQSGECPVVTSAPGVGRPGVPGLLLQAGTHLQLQELQAPQLTAQTSTQL